MVFKFALILTMTTQIIFGQDVPHLILHFDINKTLIASDEMGGKTVENVLNELLAEHCVAQWDDQSETMTYERYVKDKLLPGDKHDEALRLLRKEHIQKFISNLKNETHSLYPVVHDKFEKLKALLEKNSHGIFASFYKLIEELETRHISYSIILRSFGSEVYAIADSIHEIYPFIDMQKGQFNQKTLLLGESTAEDYHEIYQLMRNQGHTAIQDDWQLWADHEFKSAYGKPFYIDSRDPEVLSIFFDDNVQNNQEFNIVAVHDFSSEGFLSIQELKQSGQLVQVDTLKAIEDENYFWKCVKQAILKKQRKFR